MISAILTTHDWDRLSHLIATAESIPDECELIVVFEEEHIGDAFRQITGHEIIIDESVDSLSAARNIGAQAATGDIYAFFDDDIIVSNTWLASAQEVFDGDAIAAGGPAVPRWSHRPWYVPQLWDWLVGCGPYHNDIVEIRNTYGCNIAFRSEIFDELGGFDRSYGKSRDLGQAEETELCQRMRQTYDQGVLYHPGMVVEHTVFAEQLSMLHLMHRAYEQGRVKARMGLDSDESSFLTEAIRSLGPPNIAESIASSLYLAATGTGYLREKLTSRIVYPSTGDITH